MPYVIFNSTNIAGAMFVPEKIQTQPAGSFGYILEDFLRTSDGLPRTHGAYPSTVPSIDYRFMKCYGAKTGVPDIINLYEDLWFPLTESMQWLWMNVNCMATFHKLYSNLTAAQRTQAMAWYKNLTSGGRYATNGMAWDNGRKDFVSSSNMSATRLVEQEQITCSQNRVKLTGRTETFHSDYLQLGTRPYLHHEIVCADPKMAIPDRTSPLYANFVIDILSKDWLCHTPTISTGKNLGGGVYEIAPFSQFDGNAKHILWGKNGLGWIRSDWIKL